MPQQKLPTELYSNSTSRFKILVWIFVCCKGARKREKLRLQDAIKRSTSRYIPSLWRTTRKPKRRQLELQAKHMGMSLQDTIRYEELLSYRKQPMDPTKLTTVPQTPLTTKVKQIITKEFVSMKTYFPNRETVIVYAKNRLQQMA
jgi:hypothetical protein